MNNRTKGQKIAGWCVGIFLLVFMIFMSLAYLYGTGRNALTYIDNLEFETLQEAYDYQEMINEAALEAGAAIKRSDITVASPPRYGFTVVMSDGTPFGYGETPAFSPAAWVIIGYLIATVALAFGVCISLLYISGKIPIRRNFDNTD
jgi:hypothetical protein